MLQATSTFWDRRPRAFLFSGAAKQLQLLYRDIYNTGDFFDCLDANNVDEALSSLLIHNCDFVIVDISTDNDKRADRANGFEFIHKARMLGFKGLIVATNNGFSHSDFVKAIRAGASDFWFHNKNIRLIEAVRMLFRCLNDNSINEYTFSTSLKSITCFKCLGFSDKDIDTLQIYFDHKYPSFRFMSELVGISEDAIRRRFSRIYEKLRLERSAHLVELLTACSFYRM